MNVLKNNPARLATLVSAVVGLLTAYKVHGVSADQAVAIMAVVTALSNEFVRSAVSPVATPDPTPGAAAKLAESYAALVSAVPTVQNPPENFATISVPPVAAPVPTLTTPIETPVTAVP